MARAYTGSGAPASGTLPGGNVTFLAGDMYFDTTGKNLYVCDTPSTGVGFAGSHWTEWLTSAGSSNPSIAAKTGAVSIVNSTAENTVLSYTIPGNTVAAGSL